MKYSVKKLGQEYKKKRSPKHSTNDKQNRIGENINFGVEAYNDNEYKVLMKELNDLYSTVDSISLTEKFISGE